MSAADKGPMDLVLLHGEIKSPPFSSATRQTPKDVIDVCQARLARYDKAVTKAARRR